MCSRCENNKYPYHTPLREKNMRKKICIGKQYLKARHRTLPVSSATYTIRWKSRREKNALTFLFARQFSPGCINWFDIGTSGTMGLRDLYASTGIWDDKLDSAAA